MKKWDNLEEEKIERENSRVREFLTRSLPKKVAIVGLSAMIALSALTFAGCDKTNGAEQNTPTTPQSSQVEQTSPEDTKGSEVVQKPILDDTKPSNGNEQGGNEQGGNEQQTQVPVSTIEGFVENLRQNFTCTVTKNGEQTNYVVDDGIVKVVDGETSSIYTSDANGNYIYTLLENGDWEKNFASIQYNQDAILYDALSRATWNAYDEASNTFSGTIDGQNISFKIDGTSATITGAVTANVSKVGQTELSLPQADEVVDKTIPQEYIYQNGDYNIVLMKEVLEDWMKGNNQWGKDIMARRQLDDSYQTKEILFIKPTDERLEIGLLSQNGDEFKYYLAYINEADVVSSLKQEGVDVEAFEEKLKNIQIKNFVLSISKQLDTTITNQEFETMTENVFNKLTTQGVQGLDISNDNPETKIDKFNEAEILFGFKVVSGTEHAGYGLGYVKTWEQYYLVEYNGKLELVTVGVVSSTYNNVENEKENVVNNTDGFWLISRINREVLLDGNKALYEEVEQENQRSGGKTENLQEKGKELC